MDTRLTEIADGVFRFSSFVPEIDAPAGLTFNQFLVLGEEPLLFHTGLRRMFPALREAVGRVIAPERLRWITFGHFEADECGAMNEWLATAPDALVAHGHTACNVSLNDVADRMPRALDDGGTIELGNGKRVRYIDTPHVPHGWEAGVFYEEVGNTLFAGDLLTHTGDPASLTEADVAGPGIAAEAMFRSMTLAPATARTLRELAALRPGTLALMHGSSFRGDGARELSALADWCEQAALEMA